MFMTATTRKQIKGIRVVPIDLNNNGKITPDEDFYASMDNLIAAIAMGNILHLRPGNYIL